MAGNGKEIHSDATPEQAALLTGHPGLPGVPQPTNITPLWQASPPGPPGAAIDPPPCSPGGGIAGIAAPAFEYRSIESDPDHYPPRPTTERWLQVLNANNPFKPLTPQPRAADQVVQPVYLAKETPQAEIDRLLQESGWKPNGNTLNNSQR
jgi:hypothetical protein